MAASSVSSLTERQQRFVDAYLIDPNATKAARAAGYSAKTAASQGERLLRNVDIARALADARQARAERVQLTADDVLRELVTVLQSDVRYFDVDDAGTLTLREDAPAAAWRAVSSVKHRIKTVTNAAGELETTRDVEFRLWSKTDAIKMAGTHLGMFEERLRVDATVNGVPAGRLSDDERARMLRDFMAETRN